MSNEIREAWINICLRDEQLADFVAVKQYLGLQNNTDVIRLLIRKEAHAIRRTQPPHSPAGPRTLPQLMPSAPPDVPAGAPEPDASLCLNCPLPDCDDTDPNCPYQQATGELDRRRSRQRASVQRKRAEARRRTSRQAQARGKDG